MTTSLQIAAAQNSENVDGDGSPGQPNSKSRKIPLRFKVGVIGVAGLVNIVGCMYVLYPLLPHGKTGSAPALVSSPSRQTEKSSAPTSPEAGNAAVREVLSELAAHQATSAGLSAVELHTLQAMQAKLDLAERDGNKKAKYLLGILDYLIGQANGNPTLQAQGTQRIRSAVDLGVYLARFDSMVLLKKPYLIDDDYYKSAKEAAEQGFMPAKIDVARYLSNLGKDGEALPLLESVHTWDGTAPTAAVDDLSKFRMALTGAATASSLRQYSGLSKYMLAMLLVEGKVAKQDLPRARQLLAEASRSGIPAASVAYAKMLLSGQGGEAQPQVAVGELTGLLEKPQAETSCVAMFEECGQSHRDAAAYLVAINHLAGVAGFEKVRNSLALLQPLVDKGDADAKSLLGWVLSAGIETRKDPKKGFELLSEAADAGVVDAKYWLARCYLDGNGTKRDIEKGAALLAEAAEAGHQDAATALAAMKK